MVVVSTKRMFSHEKRRRSMRRVWVLLSSVLIKVVVLTKMNYALWCLWEKRRRRRREYE